MVHVYSCIFHGSMIIMKTVLCWDTASDNGNLMHKQVYRAGKCLNRTWYSIKILYVSVNPLFSIKWTLVVNLVRMLMIETFMLLVHDVQLSRRTSNVAGAVFLFAFCILLFIRFNRNAIESNIKSIVTFATVLVNWNFLFSTTLSSYTILLTWHTLA